ncbi:MAG: alkaline phosphatase family protein [Caldilineaceae bacterium]|nr:alkaline phosphatase family protein [Caldilineaceae bacterium]
MKEKKVLLFVIDALASDVFFPALDAEELPNFQRLVAQAQVDHASTAVFPSITHCALSSLATGTYPDQHGVPGGYWFDVDKENVIYYIGDFWTILNEGIGKFFTDLLVSLNAQHVQKSTIFEITERAGLNAACINHLIHRGAKAHKVNSPLLIKLLPGLDPVEEVQGPSILFLGDLVHTSLENGRQDFAEVAGIQRRYGFDDEFSADVLLHLAKQNALPDLTLTYFMDNDYKSHEVGPQNALPVLQALDKRLGELFDIFGGVEQLLQEYTVVITGDHSQCSIKETEEDAVINVTDLLKAFRLASVGQTWQAQEDIVACPNMRSLQLYFAQPAAADFPAIAEALLADNRVDQVMWRPDLENGEQAGYMVQTKERGTLRFWPSDEIGWLTANHARDPWNRRWQWEGDLAAVDAECYRRKLLFNNYPNAFERIACALNAANGGHMWATAVPGTEFQLESSLVHVGGGSHGSLHRVDSTMPLIVAGAPRRFHLPEATRTVDVLPICLSILGVQSEYSVGASHVQAQQ